MPQGLTLLSRPETDWAAQSHPARPLRIALVNMPWARCDAPSIQCGLLKADLAAYGHNVDVHYFNLDLSARFGSDLYEAIWNLPGERQSLLGDWLFGHSLYQTDSMDAASVAYLDRYSELIEPLKANDLAPGDLDALRTDVLPRWIDAQAREVDWAGYDIVGFSSTFAQNVAALALAKQIKALYPQVVILFGGANFDGEMGPEYVRVFPFIDCAVSGEGDLIVPVLAARISRGFALLNLPGVTTRVAGGHVVSCGQAPKVVDMDALPEPDYTDYFATLDRCGRKAALGDQRPALLFEASRGCWWGEKHHCTFCGLNAQGMAYRSKAPARVVDELASLVSRYRVLTIAAVDNIMDMRYLSSVCSQLRDAHWDLSMFFEVKANLSRDQVRALRDAGITQLQPGIESLSSNVLSLMRKGSTMLTNVRLLKWCRYYNMHVSWNILAGFPGERDADYEEQISLIPSLLHLTPPAGVSRIWLERFSPYFNGEFPMFDVRPQESYNFVYPMADIDAAKIAYFFDYRVDDVSSDEVRRRLIDAVDGWRQRWFDRPRPALTYQRGTDWISIVDSRGDAVRRFTMDGWRVAAYELCSDQPRAATRVRDQIAASTPWEPELAPVIGFLDSCVANRLMVNENGLYLALALPQNPNRYS